MHFPLDGSQNASTGWHWTMMTMNPTELIRMDRAIRPRSSHTYTLPVAIRRTVTQMLDLTHTRVAA